MKIDDILGIGDHLISLFDGGMDSSWREEVLQRIGMSYFRKHHDELPFFHIPSLLSPRFECAASLLRT